MKSSTSGTHCPNLDVPWANGDQALAANTKFTIGPVPFPGAIQSNSLVLASFVGPAPETAGGSSPTLRAQITTDNNVSVTLSNPSAAALVALGAGAAATVRLIALPVEP